MKCSGKKIGFTVLALLVLGSQFSYTASVVEEEDKEKIDDWEYVIEELAERSTAVKSAAYQNSPASPASPMKLMEQAMRRSPKLQMESLGFSVGGAKDADNFFQNLQEGYLPRYSSLSYEGLFYDYTFDTGQEQVCEQLFCPSYARGLSRDLFSGGEDYYLSLGLNSGLTEESFKRKKLNLVVVLDISGSMSSPFNAYYYDGKKTGGKLDELMAKSKMEVANQSIVTMLEHLHSGDRFGMVLFDDQGYRAKPLRLVGGTDMQAISKHILDLRPRGGTNMGAGMQQGVAQFSSIQSQLRDPALYENRIVFLTDAMPNRGALGKGGLFGMVREAPVKNIFTTFIGVGVDFNPDLVEHITKTRGANYFAVHSHEDFKKRLDEEFDFMVTPLVFDLELQVESSDYEIVGVFGSPEADLATGEVMKISTLFPSAVEEEEVRGGVVLVKLKKLTDANGPVLLRLSYEDRNGKHFQTSDHVQFDSNTFSWDNNGIRKAALLTEYVSLLKNWLMDSRKGCNDKVSQPTICFSYLERGLVNPDFRPERSRMESWEQRSCTLEVSEGYQKFFTLFTKHFKDEMSHLGDSTLQKELDVLNRLTGKVEDNTGKKIDDWKIK